MLSLYRRHLKTCEHRGKGDQAGRKWKRCRCPVWADGRLGKQVIRQSLKETDWNRAAEIVDQWRRRGSIVEVEDPGKISIEQATKDFIADKVAQRVKERTVYKFRLLFRRLTAFSEAHGFRYIVELDTSALRKFRATWTDSPSTSEKNLERMRGFFNFARENGWVLENSAKAVKKPKVAQRPTLPFSRDEMIGILELADRNIARVQRPGRPNAQRLRALILFLRYTGLRIGDAVGCSIDRLADGKLRLYTQKTGQHVYCPLPEHVIRELEAIPAMSPKYWFWSGNGKLQTAVTDWQGRLASLFDERVLKVRRPARGQLDLPGIRLDPEAGQAKASRPNVQDGHAHRFRDTFSVELLLAGVPVERVAAFLGNSAKIVEKHYSPWIRERQEQAEADVRRTWAQDPIALLESPTRGTPDVRGEDDHPAIRPN